MKLCVQFPGIGYHCDKPLMYYSGKLAKNKGYEVKALKFGGFDRIEDAGALALRLAEEQLAEVDFSQYESVIFIGKSIGTVACLAYREKYGTDAKCALLTPLEITFDSLTHRCIAFHGTSDPWADTANVRKLCQKHKVTLYEYENGNHSLETGDVSTDIRTVSDVMEKLDGFI